MSEPLPQSPDPTPTDESGSADEAAPPPNRAARRGKARGHDTAAPNPGFGRRARPAQGRRFNPIRRTG
jgi:hypothetical protein